MKLANRFIDGLAAIGFGWNAMDALNHHISAQQAYFVGIVFFILAFRFTMRALGKS